MDTITVSIRISVEPDKADEAITALSTALKAGAEVMQVRGSVRSERVGSEFGVKQTTERTERFDFRPIEVEVIEL